MKKINCSRQVLSAVIFRAQGNRQLLAL